MMDVANSTLSANEPSGDVVADGQQALHADTDSGLRG